MNTEAVKTFYDLLEHKKQTEIRAIELSKDFKTSKVKGHYFVSSAEEFIDKIQEFNGKYNLYAGLNERTNKGTEAKDVISVKRIFVDIDCIKKPAIPEDLQEAEKVTDEIISKIEEKTGLRATKIYSGNGYQLIYSIPEIEITDNNREEVQAQVQQFLKDLIKKYSNNKVKLDNVGDLPRIIRITGTTNIKGGKTSGFIEVCKEENSKLKDYILSLKPETSLSNIQVGELETSLKDVLEKDERVKKLFEGDIKGFVSRSEAEQSLVCHLIGLDFDKQQIFKIMASCKIGKWQTANIHYRDLTFKKALEVISKKKKEDVQRQIKEVNCYEDIPINPETSLNIFNPLFEGVEKISLNPLQVSKRYKIYKAIFGIGQNPIFIITKPNEFLNQGFQDLRLRKIDFEDLFKFYCQGKNSLLPDKNKVFEKEILNKYAEEGLSTIDIFKKEFERYKKRAFFYEKIKPTTNSNLIKAIQKMSFDKMLKDFILENGQIDKRLQYAFRVGLLNFGNEYHKGVSKYNNHNLIITNTKTGKSTQLEKQTKLKYDSATANRLLGYSTGEKSFEGDIQGQYKQIVLDDFSSANYQKEILDSLPSILENGKSLIGKGKKQILTECSSQFTLTTNSNKAIEEKQLVLEFVKIINRLSETPQRIGSRFSCVLFGNDFEEAQTKEFYLSKKEIEINKFLVEQIFEELSEFFIKLLDNSEIEKFLESKNLNYRETIQGVSRNEHNFFGELKDFWESTISGDRHQRGFALKQGLIDYFIENQEKLVLLLENKLEFSKQDINKIIELSEENLDRLNDLNFQSLRNIIKAQKTEGDYLNLRFKGLRQEYLKAIIKGLYKLIRSSPEQRKELIPLIMLNDYLDKTEPVYNRIGKVQEKLPKNLDRLNKDLRIFGFELFEKDETILIQTHNEILEFSYKIKLGTTGTTGTNEEKTGEKTSFTDDKQKISSVDNNNETGTKRGHKEIYEFCPHSVPTLSPKNNIQNNQMSSINNNNVPIVPKIPINNKSQDNEEIDFSELDKEFEK